MKFWKRGAKSTEDAQDDGRLGRQEQRQDEEIMSSEVEQANEPTIETGESQVEDESGGKGTGLSPTMQIRDRIVAVLKTVYDPEIPVDIYELGLIYGLEVTEEGEAHVTMTLTSPMCPVAETLPPEVEDKVRNVIGVKEVSLDLVWDPPWSVDMMSDAARLDLNMM